jgi:hypothetical protein
MLHLILANTPDAFACGELVSWYRPAKKHHKTIDCACGQESCEVWKPLLHASPKDFYAVAGRRLDVRILVDSSKELSWLLDVRRWAKAHDIVVRNVFIWKDPIDLAYSYWKRGHDAMFWRSQFVKYYSRVFDSGLPCVTVSLNRLLRAPQQTVRETCRALGTRYHDGQERFWEGSHHHLFGSLGARLQVLDGASVFQTTRAYDPAFQELTDQLRNRIESDQEVQEVIEKLRPGRRIHVREPRRGGLRGTRRPSPLVLRPEGEAEVVRALPPREGHAAERKRRHYTASDQAASGSVRL